MEHKLENPIQVMNKDAGEYQDADLIVVNFTGKKGLKAIKKIQDVIYGTFAKNASTNKDAKKTTKDDADVTIDDVLTMLAMTGSSEEIFDVVMSTLQAFATIENQKLDEKLQELMSMEDLDALCNGVLKTFLLPSIIQKMNSMKK